MINIDAFYGSHNRQNFSRNNMLGLGQNPPPPTRSLNREATLKWGVVVLGGAGLGYALTRNKRKGAQGAAIGAGVAVVGVLGLAALALSGA